MENLTELTFFGGGLGGGGGGGGGRHRDMIIQTINFLFSVGVTNLRPHHCIHVCQFSNCT